MIQGFIIVQKPYSGLYFIKAFMEYKLYRSNMAKGWRRLLEEESEYQWLAISLFFAFILVGAFAIHGTGKLSGMDFERNGTMEGSRILKVHYDSNGGHTAVAHTNDGTYLYQYVDDKLNTIIDPINDNSASNITYLTELSNGTMATSSEDNSIIMFSQSTISNFEISSGLGIFRILDLAVNIDPDSDTMIAVTDEGFSKSIRGINSNGVPTSPMPNSQDIDWESITPIADNEWIITGIIISSSTGQGNNPASPDIKPVMGHVIWTGGVTSPMLNKLYVGTHGQYHSTIKIDDKMIIAGTGQTTIFDSSDQSLEHLTITSSAAIGVDNGVVWFFGNIGSESVIKWTHDEQKVIQLQHRLPIEIEAYASSSEIIYMHGTDSNDEPKLLSLDTTSHGSIESGRGFLNFAFLLVFSIGFVVMGWNVLDRMKS
jgi:hypothetical protein